MFNADPHALHREVRHTQGPRQCHTSYDPLGRTRARLSELTGQHGVAGAQMLGATYEYDLAGNVRQVTRRGNRPHERSVLQYTYDVMGRMTGCHDDDGRYERYAYDAADNLIDATRDATASKVLNDLLTRFRDTGYTYDGFGQLCRKTQDGMVQDFVYDDEGRMVRASGQSRSGFHSTRYAYDAIGRRTGKITSRTAADGAPVIDETRFVWEGMRMVQVLRSDTVQTYVYSPDSPYRPMARVDQQVVTVGEERVAGRQATVWHHHAHDNGQVHSVTDGNGDLVWQPRFSGLGEFRGAERHDYKLFDEPLRFAGQYADEEIGLHYNLFRYYDPQVGRFVTQDPIGLGGGVNLYAYAPNPISWIDPWGLCSITPGKNFKDHFIRHKGLLEKILGKKYPKWKDGEGIEFLKDIEALKNDGRLVHVGQGTLKKDQPLMEIYRGEGLTYVAKKLPGGGEEFVTLLESGKGMDAGIIFHSSP